MKPKLLYLTFFLLNLLSIASIQAYERVLYAEETIVVLGDDQNESEEVEYFDPYEFDEFYEESLPVGSVLDNQEIIEFFDDAEDSRIQVQNGFHGR